MKFPSAIKFWIYLEYEVEMNQGFVGVCAREGAGERREGLQFFGFLVWSRFERALEELICLVISLFPSSKYSHLPTGKEKPGENLFLGTLIQA